MIKFLSFDSDFFGYKIGSIELGGINKIPDVKKILKDGDIQGYDCLYIELSKSQKEIIRYFQSKGIYPIEERVVLLTEIKYIILKKKNINEITPKVARYVKGLADEVSQVSRFFRDELLRNKAKSLYELWIEKSLYQGFCKKYFIKTKYNAICGVITLKERQGYMYIDLFGVLEKFRKRGIGTLLLQEALDWCYSQNIKTVYVTTQADNTAALSVYKAQGFSIHTKKYYYHCWLQK